MIYSPYGNQKNRESEHMKSFKSYINESSLSRIRGRAFAFEEVEPPSTRNGKWAQWAYARRIDSDEE